MAASTIRGSALKPFTYALGFEPGYEPASVLPDITLHFPTAEPNVLYSPRNYDGRLRGPMRARLPLAGSENIPAVALLSELGVPSLVRFMRQAGFSTFDKTAAHYGLGLTLGNAEVRLDELVNARGGSWIPTRATQGEPAPGGSAHGESPESRSAQRGLAQSESAKGTRLISSRTAFWISDILSDPHAHEYAFGRGGSLEFPFAVAAKTGTSQAYHDNWAIGMVAPPPRQWRA